MFEAPKRQKDGEVDVIRIPLESGGKPIEIQFLDPEKIYDDHRRPDPHTFWQSEKLRLSRDGGIQNVKHGGVRAHLEENGMFVVSNRDENTWVDGHTNLADNPEDVEAAENRPRGNGSQEEHDDHPSLHADFNRLHTLEKRERAHWHLQKEGAAAGEHQDSELDELVEKLLDRAVAVFSPPNSMSKFTENIFNCIGGVLFNIDEKTKKPISELFHFNTQQLFQDKHGELQKFKETAHRAFAAMKEKAGSNRTEPVFFGGAVEFGRGKPYKRDEPELYKDYRSAEDFSRYYRDSLLLLTKIAREVFGPSTDPTVVLGPSTTKTPIHAMVDTLGRNIFITEPEITEHKGGIVNRRVFKMSELEEVERLRGIRGVYSFIYGMNDESTPPEENWWKGDFS